MKKIEMKKEKIRDLYAYLKSTKENEIHIPTTYVDGCWYDNESDANSAGFDIYRYFDKERQAKHLFSECYCIIRRVNK